MRQTRTIMSMPVIIEISDTVLSDDVFKELFSFLEYVDQKFSTFKSDSEISLINSGALKPKNYSDDMKKILLECEKTKMQTNGYFDLFYKGKLDPSGIVKGWAIFNAAQILKKRGFRNYFVEISGDIEIAGNSQEKKPWSIGIRNPFKRDEIIKTLSLSNCGIATSGTYEQGQHVYNPLHRDKPLTDIVSITVVGPNVFDADRFATAAFAMQKEGITFIEQLNGFEGYMIDRAGIATETSNFHNYVT